MQRRGSTLPEVLIGMGILIPVAIVVVGLFPYAHTIDHRAWALSTARGLAESELEKARATSFNSITNTSYHSLQRGLDFFVNVTVAPVDAQLLKLSADVSWQFQRGQDFRLVTMIARTASP